MRTINPVKSALSVGIVLAAYHFCWLVLVATGAAKPFLDFVMRLHFLRFEFSMAPFEVVTGLMLLGLTFAIGAVVGLVFAFVWNWLGRRASD